MLSTRIHNFSYSVAATKMHARRIIAAFDKVMTNERELYKSKFFPELQLSVIVDSHFIKQVSGDTVSFVKAKDGFDVTLERHRQVIQYPSQLAADLLWFDQHWNDGTGLLDKNNLALLFAWL